MLIRIAIIATIFVIVFYFFPDAERNNQGEIVSEGNLGVFSLKVGDCLKQTISNDSETQEFETVDAVPCNEPHESEVFYEEDNYHLFLENEFPENTEEIKKELLNFCVINLFIKYDFMIDENFEVNPKYTNIGIVYFSPTKRSWLEKNDKKVQCLLYDMTGKSLVGKFSEHLSGF